MTQRPSPTQYNYDPRSRRYRDTNGRYISAQAVRSAVDQLITAEAATLRQHAQDMLDGKINFAEWQLRSLATIKTLHVAVGIAGNGGRNNTSPGDYAYMGNLLKTQYQYFRGMVADIKKGKQRLDGTLLARIEMYGQAARGTYHNVMQRGAMDAGLTESRRTLGVSDHCQGCLSEAARGWVPIGQSKPIGTVECKSNCRCDLIFR